MEGGRLKEADDEVMERMRGNGLSASGPGRGLEGAVGRRCLREEGREDVGEVSGDAAASVSMR